MEKEEIQLIRPEADTNKHVLTGINGDTVISNRIVEAVERSGRLFPYVVRSIAQNRINQDTTVINVAEVTEHMREVRDELTLSLKGLEIARNMRHSQAANLTVSIGSNRPPYFVR